MNISVTSRDQARIDFGLVAGLTGMALAPGVDRDVRVAAGFAAAALSGVSVMTDYEGGMFPTLTFAQHRGFGAACGTALCIWGLRQGGGGGRALALAGSVQLATAVMASGRREGPPDTIYGPTDTLKKLAENLWVVDSVLGPGLPVRMTVVRLQNGDLLLHSPTRFSAALRAALEGVGPIRHLVAPNIVHWTFIKAWQDAVSDAVTWGAPGLAQRGTVRRSGLRIDHELSDTAPAAWEAEIEQAVVRGGGGFAEVAMLHRPSRTVLLTDLVQNIEVDKLPWVLRPLARMLGNLAPEGRAPAHLRALVHIGGSGRAAARRVVAWAPERIVVAHGAPIETDAAGKLRRSLAWLTEKKG